MTDPVAMAAFRDEWSWRERIFTVAKQVHLLTVLLRSSRVPLLAKVVAGCSIAYVFSPIQVIPSFIPIIGQLDDLAVLCIGTKLTRKLTPPAVLHDCEAQSESTCFTYLENWRHNALGRKQKFQPSTGRYEVEKSGQRA